MKLKAVIFDFDMTLIDSSHALLTHINQIAVRFGLPCCTYEKLMSIIGLSSKDFWPAALGEWLPEYKAFYLSECRPHEHELMRPMAGAETCLQTLKASGLKTGCASNRKDPLRVLEESGLLPLMDCAVGVYDVPNPKPAPDMLFKAANLLNVTVGECLYVGDSVYDVAAAKAAGMRCVTLLTSTPEARLKEAGVWRICSRLADLPALIAEIRDKECEFTSCV